MTVPIWPTELPKPTRDGYEAARGDSRLRRSSEAVPGYRRRFSAEARPVSLSINVPRSLKAVFDNFYDVTTAGGTLPFYMPDPITDGWPLIGSDGRPVLTDGDLPVLMSAQWLCLFGDEAPVDKISGVRFDIAFSVAVMP